MTCTGPQCDRPAEVGDHCRGHYMQARRGGPLRPLRSTDPRTQVVFRCTEELKDRAERSAKTEGIEPAEWWRRAGIDRLKRSARKIGK